MKNNNYNDYIFNNDKFIGNFEEMYQNCSDPWNQVSEKYDRAQHNIIKGLIKKYKPNKILEIGCGFGHLTKALQKENPLTEVIGIDISETAITKAKKNYPNCMFQKGDLKNFDIFKSFKPDFIVLSWLLWYILDDIDDFIQFMKNELPNTKILNYFTVYPKDIQKYGKEKFNSLDEIMKYFDANYYEWGSVFDQDYNQNAFFICDYKEHC